MEKIDLKGIQRLSLELLVEFDTICRENNIEYVLCGGTLIGAVRHKGFIPWDDDIDVMMLRTEYNKFVSYCESNNLHSKRDFISVYNHKFPRHFSRYVRTDYLKKEEGFEEDDCPYIGLDIFPVDFVSEDSRKFKIQVIEVWILRKLLLFSVTIPNSGKSMTKRIIKNALRPILKKIGSYCIAMKIDKVVQKYNNSEKKYVAGLCGMYGLKEKWRYQDFKPVIQLEFEGHNFIAPKNYDIYLTNLFGDYMKLPPEDKRKYSCATVYKIENDK